MLNKSKGVSYAKYGYIFILPFVLVFLAFMLYPLIYTFVIGFTDLRGLLASEMHFLDDPFANYKAIISNVTFQNSLKTTILLWVINFIPQITLALLLTAWFTNNSRKIVGQGVFKVLFYLPNIITSASLAILFSNLFAAPAGPANDVLMQLGFFSEPYQFLVNGWVTRFIVAFIQFWMWYGYTTIILISGVLGINPELFESAEIDGATPTQTFFKITLPCMRTILIYTLITALIGGLNMFDIPKMLVFNGGPGNATMTASVFIYIKAFTGTYFYNEASAASMLLFVIIAILSVVVFFLMRDRTDEKVKQNAARRKKQVAKLEKEAAK